MSALLLHGVVPGAAPLPVNDLFGLGHLVRVEAEDMAFAASPVPADIDIAEVFADPERAAVAALGHHEILCEIAAITDVLPLRIGTAVSGRESARQRLAELGASMRPRLMRIEGLVEYRVVARGHLAAEPADGSGSDYLRKRLTQRQTDEALLIRLDRTLMQLAAAAGPSGGLIGLCSLRSQIPTERGREATIVVERDARTDFERAAQGPIEEARLQAIAVTMDGPWPAYTLSGEDAQ